MELTNEQIRNLTPQQIEQIENEEITVDEVLAGMTKAAPETDKPEPTEQDGVTNDAGEEEEESKDGEEEKTEEKEEEEEPVVLTKSGKSTIPYEKHKQLRVENSTLREQLQNATTKLEELLGAKEGAKGVKEEAKADDAIAKHLEVLKQDMPELHEVITAVLDGSRKQGEKLEQTLAELKREKEEAKRAEEKSVTEQVAEAKDNNPDLSHWEIHDPEAFQEAIRQDAVLRDTAKWANAPYEKRFEEVARRVKAVMPEASQPNKPKSAEQVQSTAKAKLEKAPARKPTTLSDIPNGADPANEKDALDNLTPSQLTAKLLDMPQQRAAAMRAGIPD